MLIPDPQVHWTLTQPQAVQHSNSRRGSNETPSGSLPASGRAGEGLCATWSKLAYYPPVPLHFYQNELMPLRALCLRRQKLPMAFSQFGWLMA